MDQKQLERILKEFGKENVKFYQSGRFRISLPIDPNLTKTENIERIKNKMDELGLKPDKVYGIQKILPKERSDSKSIRYKSTPNRFIPDTVRYDEMLYGMDDFWIPDTDGEYGGTFGGGSFNFGGFY